MKAEMNKPVTDFIADFTLEGVEKSISFESRILFLEKGIPNFYMCKTVLVPVELKNMYAVYFLDAEISRDGFKDHYALGNNVEYLDKEGLKINDENNISVYIFPLNKRKQITVQPEFSAQPTGEKLKSIEPFPLALPAC